MATKLGGKRARDLYFLQDAWNGPNCGPYDIWDHFGPLNVTENPKNKR